jgi:single-strand DNA-binding protein
MNKFLALWNLTKDIELIQNDKLTIAKTSIAINENYKDKQWNKVEKATFLNLVAFWHTANHLNKWFKKWSKILIEWKIQTWSYEKDWVKKYTTDILVETCHFAGWKSDWQNQSTIEDDENFKKRVKKEDDELSIEDLPF